MAVLQHLLDVLSPFVALQHPTDTPNPTDSFPHSAYYNAGKLDICIVISLIAVMAILRDGFRLCIFEPFARWKLTRDLNRRVKNSRISNGNGHIAIGNGHVSPNGMGKTQYTRKEMQNLNRSVLRFAEQGWSVVYYTLQWCYGLVRPGSPPSGDRCLMRRPVHPQKSSDAGAGPHRSVAQLSSYSACWPVQILLSISDCVLSSSNIDSQC